MKSISVIAAAAIAVRHAEASSRPEIITAPTTTPNCNVAITKEMLTEECGYSLDKPCYVTRKYDPNANPSNMCNKKYIVASNSIAAPNMIYVQAIENDNTITEDFRFHQKAWQGICPYQCTWDGTCKNTPDGCSSDTSLVPVFQDYIRGGIVIPGSASATVLDQDVQWISLDANGDRDDVDNSAATNRVEGAFTYQQIYAQPMRITNSTVCEGLSPALTLAELMNTECGGPNQVPCAAALADGDCGTCFEAKIYTDGLKDDGTAAPKICSNGDCYMNIVEKVIKKVALPEEGVVGFNRFMMAGMGLWTQREVCPYLCEDATTGAKVCVLQPATCLATLATNTTVPAAGGWAEYVEPGSMKAGRFTVIVGGPVTCPTASGNSAVGRTAGGFAMSLFVLAAMAALM